MSDISHMPDPQAVAHQASVWIARLSADDVTAEDRARFVLWKSASSRNARTYDDMLAVFRECEARGPLVRAVSFGQSMNEAGRPRARPYLKALAAAATVAAVALAGAWWFTLRPTTETFQTAVGEEATVHLPDGSTLELNSGSLARVVVARSRRVVYLDRGQAFFQVVHDASRPLAVFAQGALVRDVGTSFDVDIRPGDVRVTVTEGSVALSAVRSRDTADDVPSGDGPLASEISVSAGEQGDVEGHAVDVKRLSPAALSRLTAWRRGTLEFDADPLSEVTAVMGRYTSTRIVIDDPSLAALPIGGSFRASPQGTETFVSMLKDGLRLPVTQTDNTIHIGSPRQQLKTR